MVRHADVEMAFMKNDIFTHSYLETGVMIPMQGCTGLSEGVWVRENTYGNPCSSSRKEWVKHGKHI